MCAIQRAEHLWILGVKSVLELCVGPSLPTLTYEYNKLGIECTGNDIDTDYKLYCPQLNWSLGDARTIDKSSYDAVVVAPPLTKGCSGTRQDALSLEEVYPSYYDFLALPNKVIVLVLPGKTLSIKEDRTQLYKLLSKIGNRQHAVVPLVDRVTKYVDIYIGGPWNSKIS